MSPLTQGLNYRSACDWSLSQSATTVRLIIKGDAEYNIENTKRAQICSNFLSVPYRYSVHCLQYLLFFYRAKLRVARYCYGKLSVRLSVCL